uniref:Uncharacterized protein n=1 Tax=viral metagenome TaxID=1070528 RepID=A0A6M3L5T5_9ZZZZ
MPTVKRTEHKLPEWPVYRYDPDVSPYVHLLRLEDDQGTLVETRCGLVLERSHYFWADEVDDEEICPFCAFNVPSA